MVKSRGSGQGKREGEVHWGITDRSEGLEKERIRYRKATGGQGKGGFTREKVYFVNFSLALRKGSFSEGIFHWLFDLEASAYKSKFLPNWYCEILFLSFSNTLLKEKKLVQVKMFPRAATGSPNYS